MDWRRTSEDMVSYHDEDNDIIVDLDCFRRVGHELLTTRKTNYYKDSFIISDSWSDQEYMFHRSLLVDKRFHIKKPFLVYKLYYLIDRFSLQDRQVKDIG